MRKTLLVISNPTIDYVVVDRESRVRAGGPGLYCGLYAGFYGFKAVVYGLLNPRDYVFVSKEYSRVGVELKCDFSSVTQKFMLIYLRSGDRIDSPLTSCVEVKSLHKIERLAINSRVVLWSPTIAYDGVELEVPLRTHDDQVISIDLQGVARRPKHLPRILRRALRVEVDYVHASLSEFKALFGEISFEELPGILSCREALISNGGRELFIIDSKPSVWVVKPPVTINGDSTGAGDVLLSIYSILRCNYGFERAVRIAVSNATLHVKSLNNPQYKVLLNDVEKLADMVSIYKL